MLDFRFVGGGHGGFAAFFNAGVHTVLHLLVIIINAIVIIIIVIIIIIIVIITIIIFMIMIQVMYLYYFLSAFGPKMQPFLWWKK